MTLTMGANAPLSSSTFTLDLIWTGTVPVDISALTLRADGKVRGDGDMCFYNQPSIWNDALQLAGNAGRQAFHVYLDLLPQDVERIVFTATLDEPGKTFHDAGDISITGAGLTLLVEGKGRSETALILFEIYRRNGAWKLRNVSQGFNGGLAALATHFGIEITPDTPAPSNGPAIDLTKRLVDLEKKAPELVSLVKKVALSLEKKGNSPTRAKVCLCLDISGSMDSHYSSGRIDTLVERILALGLTFDDDGEIDVFLFGKNVHEYGTVNVTNYKGFSRSMLKQYRLEGGTRYGDAMQTIRDFYRAQNDGQPVFVMFVTDGSTDDKAKTRKMLIESSSEPIFWKFMGIIPDNSWSQNRTSFLQELDDLKGRVVDNADFFNVKNPADPDDQAFFENVMEEYPEWQSAARTARILA